MAIDDIALTLVPGLGVKGVVHLLEVFGTAQAIFAASADELSGRAELRPDIARSIAARKSHPEAERELRHCRRHGITPLASTDDAYPALLREIPDYPHVLYIKGNAEVLSQRCLSMVGTRRISTYGQRLCDELVRGLTRIPQVVVVSGLAFGVDVACHRAALAAGIPTVGVLANPLPDVTPAQHTSVALDMIERGGALISELHSQSKQRGTFYLARNRIIAGLSAGTVVIESPASGGSLATAHYADGYDRTVMAPPGRTTDANSFGTNSLIRNRKAQLVLTADDVIANLKGHEEEYDALVFACGDAVPVFAQHAGEPWNRDLMEVLKTFGETGKPMIGHCAAGMMFGFAGVAAGRRVAVHPMAKAAVTGPVATDAPFEIDGNFFTAQEEHAIPAMIGRVVEALK